MSLPTGRAPHGLVRAELLVRSPTVTACSYRASATHRSNAIGGERIAVLAGSYDDPRSESHPIAVSLGFCADHANVVPNVSASSGTSPAGTSRTEPPTEHA